MKLRTQLILIFSTIIFLSLTLSIFIVGYESVRNKIRDADNRVIDLVSLLHLIKKKVPYEEYKDILSSLISMKFSTGRYSLDINRIKLKEKNEILNFRKREKIQGKERVYKAIIKDREGKKVYELNIFYSVGVLYRDILSMILIFIIAGLLVFLLGFVMIYIFSSKLTSPIEKLKKGMEEVGRGNFKVKVKVNTRNEIGYLAESFNSMTKKLDEAEFIKTVFKRYVTSQVAEKLISDRSSLKLNGERRSVSILFTDIRGFTKLSTILPPEKIISLLNTYFAPLIDIIFSYEGVLDKFLGDGLLAFWNAPLNQENFTFRAVEAALDIRKKVMEINRERSERGEVVVDMGIGLNIGEVIAGNIGSSKRMEYTVVGAPVNIASRIQGLAHGCKIYTTEEVAKLIEEKYEVKKVMENVEIKGVVNPVNIYEIIGRKS